MGTGYGFHKRLQVYVVLLLLAFAAAAFPAQVCDLTFTACPSKLPAGNLAVPLDVIGLDARIPYCPEMGRINAGKAPSIMFVIDHSGSMRNTDPTHARYTVVNTLLDSIHAVSPSAKVGISIFSDRLAFDYRDNRFFKALFAGDTGQHDSYIPLTSLDTVFGDGGKRGLDTLKALIKIDRNGLLMHATKRPKERTPISPLFSGGTDITLGFDAALAAMRASTSPKENQYIIFLSDGEPSVSDDLRVGRAAAFMAGLNTPTTFTVYFDPDSDAPPETIARMTENIKANKYSTSNPQSATYTINLPGSELQTLLQQSVLNQILTPTTGKNVTVEIAGGPKETTADKSGTLNFLLSKGMPVNAGLTSIRFSYGHTFRDSTFSPPLLRDTVIPYGVTVQRAAGAVLPAGVAKTCREQNGLGLYADGVGLASVEAGQINLEARLIPAAGQACADCTVEISPSSGRDKETVMLSRTGAWLGAPFSRAESISPLAGNGRLEHTASDSIVLLWINPENPLDRVRKSFPYRMVPASLALFAAGKPVDAVTADHAALEIRLTRPLGVACHGCAVQVRPSGSGDRESVPLAASAAGFSGTFVRLESIAPVPADGKLQHLGTDSIVLAWDNPDNPQETIRRSYPYSPIAPTLALYHKGKALDSVTTGQTDLEIRLALPSGEPCAGCAVRVSTVRGADAETASMGGNASPFRGSFSRAVNAVASPGDGRLQHPAKDSIVLYYGNPLNPAQSARRSYPYVDFSDLVGIKPVNDVARIGVGQDPSGRHQWIISDAPGLQVKSATGNGACCLIMPRPVDSRSRDSLGSVGILVEAPRGFRLDLKVFSNLGQFVNEVTFTVPGPEFSRLTAVPGKETRYLRLLWTGEAASGAHAGNGVYVLKTAIKLLPMPGLSEDPEPAVAVRKVGVLRGAMP